MRLLGLFFIPAVLFCQIPANPPPYDPNDPEGIVAYPNGTGRYAWKRKGTWTVSQPLYAPTGTPAGLSPPTASDRAKMTATLDALSALLRATPEGSNPVGYFMKESRTYSLAAPFELPADFPAARHPIIYSTGFYPFYISDTLRNGVFVPDKGGETSAVYFYFNRMPGAYKQQVVAKESRADAKAIEFYTRPDTKTTYAGFPVVDGEDLMIVRGGRDPWMTVPYGRALKAAMVEYEKDRATAEQRLAGLKKKEAETLTPEYEKAMRDHLEKYSGQFKTTDPKKWKGRLEGMERELVYNREKAKKDANPQRDKDGNWYWNPIDAHADAAKRIAAMTPEEAAKPACFLEAAGEQGRYSMRGSVLPMGADPNCRELVTENFGYFDPKLPRTAPQILLVRSLGRCAKVVDGKLVGPRPDLRSLAPPQGCYRHVPIWEALDWQKVAALLAP